MPRHTKVLRVVRGDVRDARDIREDLATSVQLCHDRQAELRLTLMQTRIRLAAVMASLRRMNRALQS